MQVIRYPENSAWENICKRPELDYSALQTTVEKVLDEVRTRGDAALLDLTRKFDQVHLEQIRVTGQETEEATHLVPENLKQAMLQAKRNIEKFHYSQVAQMEIIETMPGVKCWRKSLAIEKVGLYIPGGTAPLFSTLLMLAIPAKIAGSKEIIICSPPGKDGKLHPAIIYAASLMGNTSLFKCGGVQAVAAMAFGTATIPKVDKIFGPGNQYVTLAKQMVQKYGVAIDMPAGPSEVAVYADDSGNAAFIAADLLSQAEHGADSQVLFVSTSEALIDRVKQEIDVQLEGLPRSGLAIKALQNSQMVLMKDEQVAMELVNAYAPEHLILSCKEPERLAELVTNAGSVFLGNYSPESVGDYASGTNHTLPTNGYARAYSGVSVDSFVKKITFQQLSKEGLRNLGPTVEVMAAAEGLEGHRNAVAIRLKEIGYP